MRFLFANLSPVKPAIPEGIPVRFRRNHKARRYILRVNADGVAWATIPRGGSETGARAFVDKNAAWLDAQLNKLRMQAQKPIEQSGILFRGEIVPVVTESETRITFAGHVFESGPNPTPLRKRIAGKLWALARTELPPRVMTLAAQHDLKVKRVSVRDQRTRWGSCSSRGVISLNWRLIQAPDFVRDYIIVHELMHLREMNHSARYWKLVTDAFPQTQTAEQWLKTHASLLRQL